MPNISIVIPGRNTPKEWWVRCISSVRRSAPDAEIICIDDGSDDKAPCLDQMAGIHVVHQDNKGPSIARNVGLDIATGEWIGFVDSDDEVYDDMFSKCIEVGERDSSDVVLCGVDVIWPDDGLMKRDVIPAKNYGRLQPADVKSLADNCLLNYIWNKVYRRSFLNRARIRFPEDAVMGEDLIFNFRCIMSGAHWSGVDCVGYRYYRTRNTLLSRYIPCLASGLRHYSSVWRQYKEMYVDGRDVLGDYGETNEKKIDDAVWRNLWRRGSPSGFCERWMFRPGLPFFKMALMFFLRRYLYVRPMRRYLIRKKFKNIQEI